MSEKKRKMIDVDPAVVEMFARVLQKLKPPPKLTISEWADRFRQMSPEASAGTGRWHTDNAPYQREIMDAIGNPHVRMVVFKSSSQVGKTEVLLNVLGYYIDYNPAPILVLQPTVEMGQTFSKDRLAPMIRDTAVLRKKMDAKSRFSGNTIMQKTFPGGHVTIVGANSPAGLASRPIKIVLADEVDRYPVSAGTEGDPLNLAQTRQTTFWDKKTVLVSTPTIKGSSRIEKSWLESTMEEWTVPCPECGEYQPMVWANVVFDRERWPRGGVQYRCESCGCIAGEYRWKAQGRKGRYAALHPEREVRGFHLNVLASSFCAWAGIVTEFLSAKEALDHGNPELMKVWVNTKLGETWEERGETADDMALLARREMYTATVPAQVLVLTCGIDVQDDRFELELVGWGVGKESWGIRYQKIYGDPLKPQIWEDLDKFLQTRWRREDGVVLDILAAAMDTGGHHTDSVYRFCLDRFYRHVYAIKGRGGTETPFVSKPSTGNRVGVPLYTIGVDNGKTIAERYSLEMNFDGTDAEIAKREQQATDSAFLNELCKDYGLILKVYSNELWIYDREAFKKKAVSATITRADIVPGSFSFSDGFDGVYTHGIWEYSNQKKKIKIRAEIGTGGRTKRISKYASSQADAERRLQAALDNANHSATKVKFTLALAQIELGEAQNIGLTGYRKLSGKYFIDKVSLTYSRNGLEQTLECSKIPDEETTTTGAGVSVTLNNAPLYYTSVDKKPVRRISGHYFLYDGINVAGRYRITNLQSRCGKTPVGKNVTGWVDAADVGGAT